MTDKQYVEVSAQDLPLTCPRPGTIQWNSHPKVGLSFAGGNETRCPYCGTLYRFTGELPRGHH